jgi:hypothetical protein
VPIIHNATSFTFIQRPYHFGYSTEYLGWCLRRHDIIAVCESAGAPLIREFIGGFKPPVAGAPEPPEYRGFLFDASQSRQSLPTAWLL